MLDVKYYKDYRHNYLIVKDNGCFADNLYQRKMISENQIKGLLSCKERYINGDMLLYYEITSKQSMGSICREGTIGMEQLKNFFVQLKLTQDRLQKYLLSGNCLVLQPEYIYQDIESGSYYFLYYPDPQEGSFDKLLNFFLAGVDSEDMEAVEVVYKMADLIQREQFVLDEILCWFQKDMEEKEPVSTPKQPESQIFEEVIQDVPYVETAEKRNKLHLKPEGCLIGAGIILAGILAYVMYGYEWSGQMWIYVILGWSAVVLLFAGAGGRYLYGRVRGKEKTVLKKEETCHYMPTFEKEEIPVVKDIGNTVYIPWSENCENKLYGMDKKNKYHIDLSRLPLTVGKLAGAVDMVINEQSISRMHAKFSRTGSQIYVTDLNSTNGTFRNGMRLDPNASEIIEPGDEIRLGKLKFIYR